MGFSKRLQTAWFKPAGQDWLSTVSLLDAQVYGALVKLRRWLYKKNWLKSHRLPVPVIVVGNVIAGGAGKTPVVIEIARFLQTEGYKIGIVSRGYGRRSKNTLEVLENTSISDSGDEPALIKHAQTAPVFVASKRIDAARALLQKYPETQMILTDDGLQHHALQRDIEIIVFDERGIGNGRLLPAGPLREPWPRAYGAAQEIVLWRGQNTQALVAHHPSAYEIARHLADFAIQSDGTKQLLSHLSESKPLLALAGIAQPEAFFEMLGALGLKIEQTKSFPDHYDFKSCSRNDLEGFNIICTEKDAVKLWQFPHLRDLPTYAVPLKLSMPSSFLKQLHTRLQALRK